MEGQKPNATQYLLQQQQRAAALRQSMGGSFPGNLAQQKPQNAPGQPAPSQPPQSSIRAIVEHGDEHEPGLCGSGIDCRERIGHGEPSFPATEKCTTSGNPGKRERAKFHAGDPFACKCGTRGIRGPTRSTAATHPVPHAPSSSQLKNAPTPQMQPAVPASMPAALSKPLAAAQAATEKPVNGPLVYVPQLSHATVQTVLDINFQLLRVLLEYQNNGWINEPEHKIYRKRLQDNLSYLNGAAESARLQQLGHLLPNLPPKPDLTPVDYPEKLIYLTTEDKVMQNPSGVTSGQLLPAYVRNKALGEGAEKPQTFADSKKARDCGGGPGE
ncbi:hypothetical protein BJ742DRAFT_156000 [Cladochytrium replicatum]|nr:hypothetical protein BJ742DRAFT_156000 [Cladochytrium replicatum]